MNRLASRALTALALTSAAGTLAVLAPRVTAGPLTPPAGAVSSTYKTLQQVEPRTDIATLPSGFGVKYVISQPGSYYLSGNLSPGAGTVGIGVFSNDVTIDLNGFAILGGGVSDDGIYCNGYNNIVVRNGLIDSCVKEGLDFYTTNNVRVENLTVRNSTNGFGIICGNATTVRDCTVTGSGAGFILGSNSIVERCTAQSSIGLGFQLGAGSVASYCTSRANGSNGFFVDSFCSISNCAITGNVGSGVEIVQAVLSEGVRVERCTISENQLDGIRQLLAVDCSFVDNTLTRNWKCAMRLKDSNLVRGNHVANNGATSGPPEGGIVVTGANNIIDGNAFAFNAPASLVITNTASSTAAVRNTFTGGAGISNSGANSTLGATTSGPGTISSTNTVTNVQH